MINKERKTCFVICPIGGNGTEKRIKSDLVFHYIIEEALSEENYEITRADLITESGKISTQIVNKLLNADLVIADLTDQNPNVFYELAVRHATKKPFIQIAEIDTELPFDVSDMRTIFYKLDEPDKLLHAIKELKKFIKKLDGNSKLAFNSPITETILYNQIAQTGTDQEKMLANIMQGINNINNELSSRISYLERALDNKKCTLNKEITDKDAISEWDRNIINYYSTVLDSINDDIESLLMKEYDNDSALEEVKQNKLNNLYKRREKLNDKLKTYIRASNIQLDFNFNKPKK